MFKPVFSNSLFHALSFVLGGNPGFRVLDYGDSVTFSGLWLKVLKGEYPQIAGQSICWDAPDTTILIVGRDAPDSLFGDAPVCLRGVNSRDHLTALSWAASWRLRHPDSATRLAIVASETGDPTGNTSSSLATLFCARDRSEHPFVPRIAFLQRPDLSALVNWLGMEEEKGESVVSPTLPLLRSCIWEGLTSTREQHHAFSNVLGAFLLTAQVRGPAPGQRTFSLQDHLIALIKSVGVDPGPSPDDKSGPPKAGCWIEPALRSQLGGAVVLDDMADLWDGFLGGALGYVGDEGGFVTTPREKFFDELGKLPARLTAFLDSGRHHLIAAEIITGQHKVGERFELFLDLRLFPDPELLPSGDAMEKVRCNFFRKLAQFGLKLLDSDRNLPWLNDDRRKRLRTELDRLTSGESIKPFDVSASSLPPEETLLPRLLALLDPTLPIIIFSSTHRSELIDPFRDYGNIITTFRKPILSGMTRDWAEVVSDLRADFTSALKQAARIVRVRDKIQTFHQYQHSCEKIILPKGEHGHLIEIFFDESEDDTRNVPPRSVCVGGIVVIRVLGVDGKTVVSDEAIYQKLAALNCLWGWCAETPLGLVRPVNAPQQRGFMRKGIDLNFIGKGEGPALLKAMVNNIRNSIGETGIVFPFALISDRIRLAPEWMEIQRGIDQRGIEKVLDSTLRYLIQYALEELLFHSDILRGALGNPKSQIAIDLAIRDYPCITSSSFLEAFGIEVRNDKRPSLHSEDGYQITSETLARTGIQWPFPSKVVRARAVGLKDFGDNPFCPNVFLPKQLHYFADTISHVVLSHSEEILNHSNTDLEDLEKAFDEKLEAKQTAPEEVIQFFNTGWILDFRSDPEAEMRIEVGRLLEQRNRVEAIVQAAQMKTASPRNGAGIDLFRDLSVNAQHLSGAELAQLIARLSLPSEID